MNKKLNPVVSIVIILAVIGVALGIMFHFADQKGPPTATSLGGAMASQGNQQGQGNRRGGPGRAGAPGKSEKPTEKTDKK